MLHSLDCLKSSLSYFIEKIDSIRLPRASFSFLRSSQQPLYRMQMQGQQIMKPNTPRAKIMVFGSVSSIKSLQITVSMRLTPSQHSLEVLCHSTICDKMKNRPKPTQRMNSFRTAQTYEACFTNSNKTGRVVPRWQRLQPQAKSHPRDIHASNPSRIHAKNVLAIYACILQLGFLSKPNSSGIKRMTVKTAIVRAQNVRSYNYMQKYFEIVSCCRRPSMRLRSTKELLCDLLPFGSNSCSCSIRGQYSRSCGSCSYIFVKIFGKYSKTPHLNK